MNTSSLPVIVIGAGPVGLAAAAHLLQRDLEPLVLEAGPSVAANIRAWSHVHFFSPWRYCVDRAARDLLEPTGWNAPDDEGLPTGQELIDAYLRPLAKQLERHIRYGAKVVRIARKGVDKVRSADRESLPFVVEIETAEGRTERLLARAVIDASGTWTHPNPIGANGLPALGEAAAADRIAYGIPDVLGAERRRYAGKRILVVGRGHSAMNVVQDLVALRRDEPATEIFWAMRRMPDGNTFGGGGSDALAARGALGSGAKSVVDGGEVRLLAPFPVDEIRRAPDGGLVVVAENGETVEVEEIVGCTGFRPDLTATRELRLGLDPWLETTPILAPMIDPYLHSCGSVRPHGAKELAHPEANFYIAGMKSYGRAPTFLLLTGYEQVRSIAAAIAGDHEAASRVELVLPETGVCSTRRVSADVKSVATGGCCGSSKPRAVATPAVETVASCCK